MCYTTRRDKGGDMRPHAAQQRVQGSACEQSRCRNVVPRIACCHKGGTHPHHTRSLLFCRAAPVWSWCRIGACEARQWQTNFDTMTSQLGLSITQARTASAMFPSLLSRYTPSASADLYAKGQLRWPLPSIF
eukprot:1138642-Pelagomonas_calceolata.AAC.5